eukprot:CAMPEP_0170186642 /NCGR_PEP_ID=MMETSP0040_2-20121228/39813_1 /TAXON_ID=641309 /ORGANISM="Lotharella oceanica, Strain CCMP622" /LENGTH=66 /DNA_ID=CAMNT_0010433467 /DNA_START=72 /DNA_END=269 /DNA_ORIENTATION=+
MRQRTGTSTATTAVIQASLLMCSYFFHAVSLPLNFPLQVDNVVSCEASRTCHNDSYKIGAKAEHSF